MLKRFLKGSYLAITLFCALPVSAGFVHQDYKIVGDEKITLHEETGMEWLTLRETFGFSIDAVTSMLEPGGKFDGWRLPTGEEVEALLSKILPLTFNNSTPDATVIISVSGVYAKAWFGWMGFIAPNLDFTHSFGMYKATANENDVLISGVGKSPSSYRAYDDYLVAHSTSFSNTAYGVFLVRGGETAEPPAVPGDVNDVPSPLPMPLLGLGAMLFAAWRGRRV